MLKEECLLSGLWDWNEVHSGSTLKPLSSLSAGEMPSTTAGWWVPSEDDGVRVCAHFRHVSGSKPSLAACAAVERALT